MSMNTEQFLQQQIDSLMISVVLKQSELESLKRERAMLVEKLRMIAEGESRTTHKAVQCSHGQYGYEHCENCLAEFAQQALSATEPQATQWLEEHDAEMKREIFDAWDDLLEDLELHGMHDFRPYIDSKAKFRRLAASKRKEQV